MCSTNLAIEDVNIQWKQILIDAKLELQLSIKYDYSFNELNFQVSLITEQGVTSKILLLYQSLLIL